MKNFLKRHFLLILFFVFLILLIFSSYKDYGIPWDEKVYFNTGKYSIVQLFNFFRIPTNLTTGGFEPTPHHLKGHGVFMDMLTVFFSLPFKNFNFETLHLVRTLLAIPIFILLYWLVNKFLNKWYALLSVFFLLIFPRFYPEIYYNAADIPATLLFTICLAYFLYYAKTKHTAFKSIVFGFILGVTINQRLILLYLPIVNFIFLILLSLRGVERRGNLKNQEIASAPNRSFAMTVFNQSVIFVSLILSLHLTHPYLLTHPLTGLLDIIKSARQYPWNAAVLFDGQFFQAGVNPLPWYYLPKSMSITIPLGTLFLFFVGNINLLYRIISGRTSAVEKFFYIYLISVFYFPFILVFILKPTLYDSWRQFIFLTIPLIIIAMHGLNFLFESSKAKEQISNQAQSSNDKKVFGFWILKMICNLKFVIWIFIVINLFSTAITMIRLHPYEYLYYNSLVGGLKGAYDKYETDYWGLGFKEAVLWFNKNVNDPKKQYKIFVEGDPLSSSYYFKPNMQLTTDLLKADYILTFTRWNFHLRHPGKTVYKLEKEGVPLIIIKEL